MVVDFIVPKRARKTQGFLAASVFGTTTVMPVTPNADLAVLSYRS